MGDVKKTAEFGQALLDYGRMHSDARSIAFHYCDTGCSRLTAGDYLSAIDFFKKCIQVSPDPAVFQSVRMLLGMCYLSLGQMNEAIDALADVIEHNKTYGYEWIGAPALAIKGTALIAQGNLKEGVVLYETAMRTFLESKSLYRYVTGHYLIGRVYSKIAQGGGEKKDLSFLVRNIGFLVRTIPFAFKKAEEHLNEAIRVAKEIGAKSNLGQAYFELSMLNKTKGKTEKARECISKAIDAFEKCEADVFLKQAKEVLAALG
jgi:tetratricopeptide (TPR) repeat protein